MKKVILIVLIISLSCTLFSSSFADPFYTNMKEELIWALKNTPGSSIEGYSVSRYKYAIQGVIVGYDYYSNRIFIVGENASRQYEMCTWNWYGTGYNNYYTFVDIIITTGIVDNISAESPIVFTYRDRNADWVDVLLEDEESAFRLCYQFHGWDYP